ncbi:hypothetical protein HMPREF1870_00208 [Bacteroidales bacterium KA00344]|nr:hypothetical protein HMPREF1870_00208 [Bacteroidales bacterium KA00344]
MKIKNTASTYIVTVILFLYIIMPTKAANGFLKGYSMYRYNGNDATSFITDNILVSTSYRKKMTGVIDIDTYIKKNIGKFLALPTDTPQEDIRLIMKYPYLVSVGRLREMYYWDSCFFYVEYVRGQSICLTTSLTILL